MNLTDFLNEVEQDFKKGKLQIIADIDIEHFLQKLTDNFNQIKIKTVYKDICRWEYITYYNDDEDVIDNRWEYVMINHKDDDKLPFIIRQIKRQLIKKSLHVNIDYEMETHKVLLLGGMDNEIPFEMPFKSINKTLFLEKYHFNYSFSETEQKKLFARLIKGGYLPQETIYIHFCHVFGGTAIPDNEMPFKPIIWLKSIGLLAYLIDNLFADTDGQNLWKITANCFLWKGCPPNKNTLKNTVCRYKQDYKEKPKGYEAIDTIIRL